MYQQWGNSHTWTDGICRYTVRHGYPGLLQCLYGYEAPQKRKSHIFSGQDTGTAEQTDGQG